jgi:hypothetical protein
MTDMKKAIDLDFDDVSGGVENVSKATPVKPLEAKTVETTTSVTEDTLQEKSVTETPVQVKPVISKEDYFIPIMSEDGSKWEMTHIRDVSGEDFLNWVKTIAPESKVEKVSASAYDTDQAGALNKKIHIINTLGDRTFERMRTQLRQLKESINLDTIRH